MQPEVPTNLLLGGRTDGAGAVGTGLPSEAPEVFADFSSGASETSEDLTSAETLKSETSVKPPVEPPSSAVIGRSELIELCAVDNELFEKTFFPETVRQKQAHFHPEVWKLLESSARQVNIQLHRGSAKTTKLRLFTIKRIAYGMSRTVLYVGISQEKAIQSISWIRKQIEHNSRFTDTFHLVKGRKWTDTEVRIYHKLYDHEVTLLPYGITGGIRGVNIDDWRPDLIVCDDIFDEENTATDDQRQKMNDLLYGALLHSLAPKVDSPDAKLCMLQTPLNKEDPSTLALNDPSWVSARHGCWTKDTENLADEDRISAWPERFSTEDLLAQKRSALARNQASVFLREMECKITAPETSSFRAGWLKFYDLPPPREAMTVIGAIDPVPPPSEAQLAKGLRKKDYEVLLMLGLYEGKFYLLDYAMERGHDPSWTASTFFHLSLQYRPSIWVVESVGYQRTLMWILKKEMKSRGIYWPVKEFTDNRSKFTRIVDAYNGPCSNGMFHVKKDHSEFLSQFTAYPDVTHDDLLDAGAMALIESESFGVGVAPIHAPAHQKRIRAIRRWGAP